MGQIEFRGSTQNNYIAVPFGDGGRVQLQGVVHDTKHPDPTRRYKAALLVAGFAVSSDGIRWTKLDVPAIPSADEGNFSYDSEEGLFIHTVQRGGPHEKLDTGDQEGTIQTELFKLSGTKRFVNVDALKGEIRVELLNGDGKAVPKSAPLTGDL